MRVSSSDDEVAFRSTRGQTGPGVRSGFGADEPTARFDVTYRLDGEVFRPGPDTLAYWLSERRRFYASESRGMLAGEIAHDRGRCSRTT